MNNNGAIMLGEAPEPTTSGFVTDATRPKDVTIKGNYSKGFRVYFKDTGIVLGPYKDPQTAVMIADRWVGILTRAN